MGTHQNDDIRAATFAPKCRLFPSITKPVMATTIFLLANRKVTLVTTSNYKDQVRYKIIYLLVYFSEMLRSELLHRIST